MGIGYQIVDRRAFDYQLWYIADGEISLRGPKKTLPKAPDLVFTGAAQTFGRFAPDPFPSQVARMAEVSYLNLGISGAGPEYYLQRPFLLDMVRSGRVHLLQLMSARSVSAGIFKCGRNNGVLEFLSGPLKGEKLLAANAYRKLRHKYGADALAEQVAAVQARWVEVTGEMLAALPMTTYLVWVSTAEMDANLRDDLSMGDFPHFVTAEMVERAAAGTAGIIDCTFGAAYHQPLTDQISGEMADIFDHQQFPGRPEAIRSFNTYYPSPAHHDLIAARVLRRLVKDGHV
ncbi:MAG: DUF6473 family protein [Pseudomonadota bacterium]